MMDIPVEQKLSRAWDIDVPVEERGWNVGMIGGMSGSGKSTLARHLWPDGFHAPAWTDRPLVDDFPAGMSVKKVQECLIAAGLGSIPAWLKPYSVLSGGERFRADVARLLAETPAGQVTVIDEYTSVVDRQVAKVASHALQKAVRRTGRQVVAVSCHADILEWLQPDWVIDAATAEFAWRSVQRHPPVELVVDQCSRDLWRLFKDHHYMSGTIHQSARCWAGYADGRPVAFTSCLYFPHPHAKNIMMGHRLVVLPDWQGLGIGGRLDDWLGQLLYEQGYRYRNVIAHPAMIRYYSGSPRWQEVTSGRESLRNSSTVKGLRKRALSPRFMSTRSFQYIPPKAA